MKTLTIDGQQVTVSRKTFEGYTTRFKVEFDVEGVGYTDNIDIYTNTTSREVVTKAVEQIKKDSVKSFRVIHAATKEQDEASARFIDEVFKDILSC